MTTIKEQIKHYVTATTLGATQTEAHVFSHFASRASAELINEVLDEMMDEGVVKSTIIDAQSLGFGYLPGLCRA